MEKELNLRKYTSGSHWRKYPVISISIAGIRFNKICDRYIRRQQFCELFYDKEEKIIGIKPIPNESIYSFRILNRKAKSNISISAKKFIRETEIVIDLRLFRPNVKSRKFKAYWDDKKKMLFADLKEII